MCCHRKSEEDGQGMGRSHQIEISCRVLQGLASAWSCRGAGSVSYTSERSQPKTGELDCHLSAPIKNCQGWHWGLQTLGTFSSLHRQAKEAPEMGRQAPSEEGKGQAQRLLPGMLWRDPQRNPPTTTICHHDALDSPEKEKRIELSGPCFGLGSGEDPEGWRWNPEEVNWHKPTGCSIHLRKAGCLGAGQQLHKAI